MALKSIAIDDSACETRSAVAVTAGDLCAIPPATRPQRKLYRYSLSLSCYGDLFSCSSFQLTRRPVKRSSQNEATKRRNVSTTRHVSIHDVHRTTPPLDDASVDVCHHFSWETFQICALGGEAESNVNFHTQFFENDAHARQTPLSSLDPYHPPRVRTFARSLRRLCTCFFWRSSSSSTITFSWDLWCTNAPI